MKLEKHMPIEDYLKTAECKVNIFRIITGETVIAALRDDKLIAPFVIIQVDQSGKLGFMPYIQVGEDLEICPRFKDEHIVMEYPAEEKIANNYKYMVSDTMIKIRAARNNIILDTNVEAAGKVHSMADHFKKSN